MPAFVGLFGLPWMLHNVLSRARIPRQHVSRSVDATPALVARAIAAGSFGGILAAILPAITVGIGGLIAGQAAAERDERAFIVSQGTAKVVYYVGAFLLFFSPGLRLTRGGMCWLISTFYVPHAPWEYWIIVCAVALCGGLASLLLVVLARWAVWLINRVPYRWISWATLALLLALITATTGWGGVGVALVATAIGSVPVLTHCRRVNCLGVLLVPLLLDMAGARLQMAKWLQLV
jgi:putative membrane protein